MDFGGQWVGGSIHHCLLSLTNGKSYDLGYDAFGRCVKRTLNGTTIYYTYDGPHPVYEWRADGTRAGWNLYGQGIDEILLRADYQVLSNGQGYFFQQNRLGSVTYLTGFSGEMIEPDRYDAFRQPTTTYSGGSFNNRFKFTGREYQEAFGIYEYRNRAYHPGLGRFLSEDPMGFAAGDSNMFRYCGGDPVNHRDPYGLESPDPKKKKDGNDMESGDNTFTGDGVTWGSTGTFGNGDNTTVSVDLNGNVTMDVQSFAPNGTGAFGDAWDTGFDRVAGSGDFSPNDHGSSGSTGIGEEGGGGGASNGSSGPGTAPANQVIPNPYLTSGPLIVDVWKNFDGRNMQRVGNAFTYGVAYPAAGAMAIWAAPVLPALVEGGSEVAAAVPTAVQTGIQTGRLYSARITMAAYVGIVTPTVSSHLNDPEVRDLFEESYEDFMKY